MYFSHLNHVFDGRPLTLLDGITRKTKGTTIEPSVHKRAVLGNYFAVIQPIVLCVTFGCCSMGSKCG